MARKTLYFDCQCGLEVYAVAEDGVLTEFNFENSDRGAAVGNIYKGRVTNVLNGMQAAFIDCGLKRNCYISVEDLFPDRSKYDGKDIDIPSTLNLNIGDEILVQIVKAAVGTKGAKVTTRLSFVGKYMIYMPDTPFVGVSRKISDAELRRNLIFSAGKLIRDNEGVIVRTSAPYVVKNEKTEELNYFRTLYKDICEKFKEAPVGELMYGETSLYARVLRDTMTYNIDKIYVGTNALKESISSTIHCVRSKNNVPVILENSGRDMFRSLGIYKQIYTLTQPRVDLKNGAYLIIEPTEALTVIDVNTGKFTGDDSLEHTVYYTNILAAREIARQVKLRNVGGIVVVDFIDMDSQTHRDSIVEELERSLGDDGSKCKVLPMSKFGLVEFTRKRTGASPITLMTKKRDLNNGAAYQSTEFILFNMRADVLDLLNNGARRICIELSGELYSKLMKWRHLIDNIKSRYPEAKIYAKPHRSYREETLYMRALNGDEPPSAGAALL